MQAIVAAHMLLAYTTAGPAQRAAAKGLRLAEENGFWEETRRDTESRQRRFVEVLHALGDDFLRFIVRKTDEETDLAKERLMGLRSFITDV